MTANFSQFRKHAIKAIEDPQMQNALDKGTENFRNMRNQAFSEVPDFEFLRDHFKAIRSATLAQLGHHLETFERAATETGAQIHWARNGLEACEIIVEIARINKVKLATKSKSMTTEEINLNEALETAGVNAVETDLGEWIVQLAQERPSHIIAPAIHKTRLQVAELFRKKTGLPLPQDDIPTLTAEARKILRENFLAAEMGISGGNIAVAETGSLVLVTNEGNGRLVTSAPPIHVAVIGIEKIAPTWDEAAVWLSLLARSGAGQPLSIYTNIITGPARENDPDGPKKLHIVLLDNGRSQLVGSKYEEVLQCIRCGACLNVCPVYQEAGGHAYDSPYTGPIGAVVTPLLLQLEDYEALPQASSLCGACRDICPVRIDLPRMLVELRTDQVEKHLIPWKDRMLEKGAAHILKNEKLMNFITEAARLIQRPFVLDGTLRFPKGLDPTLGRRQPGLAEQSFNNLWQSGELENKR